MQTKGVVTWGLITVAILAAGAAGYYFFLRPQGAGLLIEANPVVLVFVDGEQVGRTPYEATQSPGEITLKLVPEASEPLAPYETKVILAPGIKTVVRRDFGATGETSAGEVISFEKLGSGQMAISVVSTPDAAQVTLDGQIKGFTPLKISEVTAGEHQLAISSPGYLERVFSIRAVEGFRLTAVVFLAKSGEAPEELNVFSQIQAENSQTSQKVKILETDTGFLRVRAEPTTATREVGQVKPGEIYELVDEDKNAGWYKIKFGDKEGWVSGEYAAIQSE